MAGITAAGAAFYTQRFETRGADDDPAGVGDVAPETP